VRRCSLRSDNGPDLVSRAILEWIAEVGIGTALIDPGKSWQNGSDESFNGKLRDECLSIEWFRSRVEAAIIIETWRRHYNAVRPHSSLNYLTPLGFKRQPHYQPSRLPGMNGPKKPGQVRSVFPLLVVDITLDAMSKAHT
jgi:putative transposase